MPTPEEMAQVSSLLKEGRVSEAALLNDQLVADAKMAEAEAAGRPVEPPPPRAPQVILRDILGQIAHDLGNRPTLEALLHEFDEATK
jgi:hypothetical protein